MTPLAFLVANSWYFVGAAITSIICFCFRKDFVYWGNCNIGDIKGLSRPTLYYDYAKPLKYVWRLSLHLFYIVAIIVGKLPVMLTSIGLALISMIGSK